MCVELLGLGSSEGKKKKRERESSSRKRKKGSKVKNQRGGKRQCPLLPLMHRILCILSDLPHSSAFSLVSFQFQHIPFLIHAVPCFLTRQDPSVFACQLSFGPVFLLIPSPGGHFATALCSPVGISPILLLQSYTRSVLSFFFNWLCLIIFLTATVFLLDIGLSFVPAPKQTFACLFTEMCLRMLERTVMQLFWKHQFRYLTQNYLSLPQSKMEQQAEFYLLGESWAKGEKYAVFLF